MLRVLALTAALLIHADTGQARQYPPPDSVGDAYDIRLSHITESATDDGASSSSSRSGGQLIERVVAVQDQGVELEFDLPTDATDEERARDWQWPAKVMKSPDGSLRLLNARDVEARIDAWLALGGMTREACGHWVFTWNAFKIECDPQSVIDTLGPYDLRLGPLRDGASYAEPGSAGPTTLHLASTGPEGSTFVAETAVDPDSVRRERAEADVIVADISGEPTTLEAALEARAAEQVEGAIHTTIVTDGAGRVIERTTVTRLAITDAEGVIDRRTSTRTVERRWLDPAG
ncbi:MAG TPA: hypothetical protein VFF66_04375 [Brevundimonas sp.]|nr:hypothetical protein [Brevundimonas sp.]